MSKVRISALAKELRVDTRALLERLSRMGEYVKTASSTVDAAVVQRLKESHNAEPIRAASRTGPRPAQPQSGARRDRHTSVSSAAAEAAAFFGVGIEELPASVRVPRGSRRRSRWEDDFRAVDEWLLEFIEPAEKKAFLDAGVFENELLLVLEWKGCGMTPEDLLVTWPSGRSALEYLRRAERTPQEIAKATKMRKAAS